MPQPETTIRIGQIWQEVDLRFPNAPHKEVRGFTDDGRVVIGPLDRLDRATKAQRKRFNGKPGGYRLIREAIDHAAD